MSQLPSRPATRSDGSAWFLNDDPKAYPISQAFEIGPTIREIDQEKKDES